MKRAYTREDEQSFVLPPGAVAATLDVLWPRHGVLDIQRQPFSLTKTRLRTELHLYSERTTDMFRDRLTIWRKRKALFCNHDVKVYVRDDKFERREKSARTTAKTLSLLHAFSPVRAAFLKETCLLKFRSSDGQRRYTLQVGIAHLKALNIVDMSRVVGAQFHVEFESKSPETLARLIADEQLHTRLPALEPIAVSKWHWAAQLSDATTKFSFSSPASLLSFFDATVTMCSADSVRLCDAFDVDPPAGQPYL